MCVNIVAEAERVGVWIGRAGGRGLIEPPRGLDVVLSGPRLGAARARVVLACTVPGTGCPACGFPG